MFLFSFLLFLFPFASLPLAAAPPGGYGYFHASFGAGVSFHVPAVSYTTRIRMFAYPAVTVGYVYDPGYGGAGYYYDGGYGYGSFSVSFSYGYPAYYAWAPVWYYYPPAWYYPPVYYYPPVHIWPVAGPYYSYHYGWYHGCGYRGHYGYPYYDRHYHTYGSRSMAYASGGGQPGHQAASVHNSRGGHGNTVSRMHYGSATRRGAAATTAAYNHRQPVSNGHSSNSRLARTSSARVSAVRRTTGHSRAPDLSRARVPEKNRQVKHYGVPSASPAYRGASAAAGRRRVIATPRSSGSPSAMHRSTPVSRVRRTVATPSGHVPAVTQRSVNAHRSTGFAPSTVRRGGTPPSAKSIHASAQTLQGASTGRPSIPVTGRRR